MAERPIFIPDADAPGFVKELSFTIPWASGFAPVQKQKNVKALHKAAASEGFEPLLEISSKSEEIAGQRLSAFNLKVETARGTVPLECAYQGGKVFERGGPYVDLYELEPREAKRDHRLKTSGNLIAFEIDDCRFPLQPTSVFYDWLYINAVYPHREWLSRRLDNDVVRYAGFTDIEFNPSKSLNCQARSCALFVSLHARQLLDDVVHSPEAFISMMNAHSRPRIGKSEGRQTSL